MEISSLQKFQSRQFLNNSIDENIEYKDPVYHLSEVFGKIVWESTLVVGVHNKCCFEVSTFVNGLRFNGTGTTLKMAKKLCALSALANYNELGSNKIQPHFEVSESYERKICDNELKISEVENNNLPLVIEEIEDNCLKRDKNNQNLKVLKNVTNMKEIIKVKNFAFHSKSKTESSEIISMNANYKLALDHILNDKVNKGNTTTMDLVSVQSTKINVCSRSFARNPLGCPDLGNEIILTGQVCNQQQVLRHAFKRPHEDESELYQVPQTKRRAGNIVKKLFKPTGHALAYLQNLNPNFMFTLECEMGTPLAPYIMISATVGNRKFFGYGKSVFLAKENAAIHILNYLNNYTTNINHERYLGHQEDEQNCHQVMLPDRIEREVHSSLLSSQNIADIIERKILQRYSELTCGHQISHQYKVLAGIVMTFNMNFENLVVVSVATGTKCINGGNICCNGSVINDSHAEILAKRGLMKFLFTQLKNHCSIDSITLNNSIFVRNPTDLGMPYILKPYVHFHLYINTAPCGDARVFSFNHRNAFNVQYGQLRTKAEGEMGTNPVGTRFCPQTWDGVVLGEPLHTMSCSDKIALWNVVGIQGALLSRFIDPIYLYSIVLGSTFNERHLYRALCGRIEHTLGYLPQPYRLNRPLLAHTSISMRRSTNKAPPIGINWTLGDNNIEIIFLPTGRPINNETSFLSKHVFFIKFNYLCKNLPNTDIHYISDNYAEAKQNAINFQICKKEALAAFYRANLGSWVKKPIEQNEFIINCD